jgi:hypothetical protein
MNSSNGFNPPYGNYQQQFATTQQNQPTASFSMQPFQQIPINFQQQYECQVQPVNLQQTYNTQCPPLNYQLANPQRMYNSNFAPLPLQQNATQTVVTSQIESDNDFELEESSDNETQEPVHEW